MSGRRRAGEGRTTFRRPASFAGCLLLPTGANKRSFAPIAPSKQWPAPTAEQIWHANTLWTQPAGWLAGRFIFPKRVVFSHWSSLSRAVVSSCRLGNSATRRHDATTSDDCDKSAVSRADINRLAGCQSASAGRARATWRRPLALGASWLAKRAHLGRRARVSASKSASKSIAVGLAQKSSLVAGQSVYFVAVAARAWRPLRAVGRECARASPWQASLPARSH